jgi:ribosomal protein L22
MEPTKVAVNPLTEEFLKKKPKAPPGLVRGNLSESSIFEDEEVAGPVPKSANDLVPTKGKDSTAATARPPPPPRNPENMAAALDPDPANRRRWERKMLIREITKRGRLTKTQLLKKQERQLISKSHDFKTSVKKLVPLAKQITGKTIDEAIVQMRFSVKKAANDVRAHLEHAKNEAIVKRGMGLGKDMKEPKHIQTKKGKRVKVRNLSTMYIEQAWCGKGLYGRTPDHRARGQINIMKNPTTGKHMFMHYTREFQANDSQA